MSLPVSPAESGSFFDQPVELTQSRLVMLAALLAASLIGFGIILWIAANWSDFDRLARIAIVGGAFGLSALLAMVPLLRIPAALVAFSAIGGLFALIGQTYQSGADPWQLFALWAALGLPLALAARHDAVWVLWAVVALVGIGVWMGVRGGSPIIPGHTTSLIGWGLSAAVALGLYVLHLRTGESRWAFRLAALLSILIITGTGLGSIFTKDKSLSFLALAVLALIAAGIYRAQIGAIGLMAGAVFGIDVLLIGLIANSVIGKASDIGGFLVLGILSAAIVGGSATLLLRLAPKRPEGHVDDRRTWPITIVSGIGALIATVPILFFVGLMFKDLFKSAPSMMGLGALILVGALVIVRTAASLSFRQQLGFIILVVGFAMFLVGAGMEFKIRTTSLLAAGVSLAAAWFVGVGWIRALLGATTANALALFSFEFASIALGFSRSAQYSWLVVAIVAALLLLLSNERLRDRASGFLPPFVSGFAASALGLMVLLSGRTFLLAGLVGGPGFATAGAAGWGPTRILGIVSAAAAIALLALRGGPPFRTPIALAVSAVALVMSALTTPLGPTLLILAAALLAHRLAVAGLAACAAIWIIGSFYYWLGWTLTEKAYLAIGMGLALGLITLLTRNRSAGSDRNTLTPMPALAATLLIGLTAAATGALAGKTVMDKENIIRNGRRIFVALAPVDPRSLMQGDYMALRFAIPAQKTADSTHAIGKLDERNVATIARLQSGDTNLAGDEIALALKHKNHRTILGTDAWFFKEGTAKTYEKARFGEFRVGPGGEMILTGMADEKLDLLR